MSINYGKELKTMVGPVVVIGVAVVAVVAVVSVVKKRKK